MSDGAESLFEQLSTYDALDDLVVNGESEGLYLECKAPSEPRLTKDLKSTLATAISGFANTAGGVIVFGLSTTKHAHSGLDIITQVEPIGQVLKLEQQIRAAVPTLSMPRVLNVRTRIVRRAAHDTRGVVVVYIPLTHGEAIQSTLDDVFYIRSGDDFRPAPYETIRRLFTASESPDLRLLFDARLVKTEPDGRWNIPILISNESTAVGEHVIVSVAILNPESIDSVHGQNMRDVSKINPGSTLFIVEYPGVIHRGLNQLLGNVLVKMKVGKRPKRLLRIEVTVYANKMRARRIQCALALAKSGFKVERVNAIDVY